MSGNFIEQIIEGLRQVVDITPAYLHEPYFGGNEIDYLKECIETTFVSSTGKFVNQFEEKIADFTGAKHAVAVVNGTAALHIALEVAGVKPGDEVLLQSLTFVATANAISYCGANPHFVDCNFKDFGIDALLLRNHLEKTTRLKDGVCVNRYTGQVIRALLLMHTFGHPSNMVELISIAADFHLTLVEDSAEALGSFYRGQHVGTFGKFGTLSFNGNKTITTGGGGMILTDDKKLAKRLKHLTTTAKLPHRWDFCHDEVGYNYRMPNINAAIGVAQLEKLPEILSAQKQLFKRYEGAFRDVSGAQVVTAPKDSDSNFWLQTLLLDAEEAESRDTLLEAANDAGYMCRPAWRPAHSLLPYRHCPKADLTNTEAAYKRLINLPSSPQLVFKHNNL